MKVTITDRLADRSATVDKSEVAKTVQQWRTDEFEQLAAADLQKAIYLGEDSIAWLMAELLRIKVELHG